MSEVLKALVAGVERPIYVVRTAEEARAAAAEIRGRGQCETVCFDTETTGLEIYQEGFRVRLVQFGTKDAAWVFVVEDSEEVDTEACGLLLGLPSLVAHNASFDIRSLGLPLWDTTTDTYLMAHLLDPREKVDGGPGFSLEELSAEYFDADALAYKDALFDRFRELGFRRTKADGWGEAYSRVPNTDEAYLRYAGVDVLLGSWLHSALFPLIVSKGQETLLAYEMVLAEICAGMMDRGFQVDAEYMERLGPELSARAEAARKVAACYGVENVNSTSQVADALLALEAPLVEKTRTGKWKVDKEVLEGLVASEGRWAPLAQAVMDAKTLEGFRVKYVQ